MRWLLVLAALAACGRSRFDERADGAIAGDTATTDAGLLGLVVRYSMDNDPTAGSVPAIPASNPAYNAQCMPNCPTPTTGHLGGAYHFTAVGGFMIPTAALVGGFPYTVALWVKPITTAPDDMCTVTKPYSVSSDANVFNMVIKKAGSVDYETTNNGGSYDYAMAGVVDLRGAWHHIAATWDGTTKRIYVDGALRGMQTITTLDSNEPMYLGVDYDFGAVATINRYAGDLDELEFYSRALSDQEVALISTR